jgi:hypothetical protein
LAFREIAILSSIIVGAVAVIGGLLAADIRLGGLIGGGGDFLSVWAGARALVWTRQPPYSTEVAGLAQHLTYGRAANPGENPHLLTLPVFLLPLFFPFALASSAPVARGIWLCLGQAAVAGSVLVSVALVEWRPPRAVLLLLAAATVFGLYSVAAMFSGTPAILLGLLYPTILWALRTERDELAGALLVLTCFMWEVGALFLILILWRVLYEKRWGVLGGLGMTLVILLATSFLLYPGWMLPFLTATVGQIRSGYGAATGPILRDIWPEHGGQMAQAIAVFLLVLFTYEWWSSRRGDFRRFVWLCLLALAVMPLLGLRTELSQLVVLSPGVLWICAASFQRTRGGGGLALTAVVAAFVLPWLLVGGLILPDDRAVYNYLFLFYPLFSIGGLYWTRWWFLRPNRTWLDEVRALRA